MKKNYNAIKRNVRKLFKSSFFRAKIKYTKYYEKLSIKEQEILIESYSGSSISGNGYQLLLAILEETRLDNYKIYVAVQKKAHEEIALYLKEKGITRPILVETHSKQYVKCLATCKYLINNSTFPSYFIKKDGQIYYNSWHGTPLKTLGRSIASSPNEIGNTQRNFFMADYLLYPNRFTFEHMKEDYMLDNFYKGKYVLSGYPRNGAFYDDAMKQAIREEMEVEEKKVICYMPTWRGTLDSKNNQEQYINIMFYLYKIDKALKEDQIMYVKLHNYVSSIIDFRVFKRIKPFPSKYETYEFLSIADCLITDYSSVFFDFANTGKKIILFAYDKKEYLQDRGMYLDMDTLPFPIVESVTDLITELNDLQNYKSYDDFVKTYCTYDSNDASKKIVDLVFFNQSKDIKIIEGTSFANDKENVLIYGGALTKNGITTSLRGLLHNINLDKRNYTVIFYRNAVKKNNYVISDFPKQLSYISIQGQKDLTLVEAIVHFLVFRLNRNSAWTRKHLDKIYRREVKRILYNQHFDDVIHFTGYEKHIANLFGKLEDTKKIMYVHNDMAKEGKLKSNYHTASILEAYRTYDYIVGVRDSMEHEIASLLPKGSKAKIKIVHNVNNIEHINHQATLPLEFNDDTFSTHTVEEIEEIINNKENLIFINIARYSPEKGIDRLIAAFEEYQMNNPHAYLIVIGGLGVLFKQILQHVRELELDHIVLIRSLNNPFPLLARSDAFVLSSLYEGLPMSIMEALILKIPVISTDITGPREFLQQGYGQLVPDSTKGIRQGFEMFEQGKVAASTFDAKRFNEQAIEEFESIFE